MNDSWPAAGCRVRLVQPDPLGEPFELLGCAELEGIELVVTRPFEEHPVPPRLEEDGLIVLGGNMSSLDDEHFPWLEDVRRLQRDAARQYKPSLGICLGAQLMAQAFGGSTAKGIAGLETGVVEIARTPLAAADPLWGHLPDRFLSGAMHGDAISVLPEGALWLGKGLAYQHQAFRFRESSWGLQFHPELNRLAYWSWVEAHREPTDEDATRLRSGGELLETYESEVLSVNRSLLRRFLGLVRAKTHAKGAATEDGRPKLRRTPGTEGTVMNHG